MNALLQLIRRMRLAMGKALRVRPQWHRCAVCSMYIRDGIATTAIPGPDDVVDSDPRICAPCRHDYLTRREGRR